MKIAIINKHKKDTLGGSEIQCDIIARHFNDRGHSVHYLAIEGEGEYDSDYPVHPVDNNEVSIVDAIKTINPDVIYWRYNKHQFFSTARKIQSLKIPFVFAVSHLNDIQKWGTKAVSKEKPFFKRLVIKGLRIIENRSQYRGFRYVDGLVVNNSEFLHKVNVPEQVCIRSSVGNHKKKFSRDRPFVVWVSSLKPSKRPEICIEIAQYLQKKGIDLLMMGPIQKSSYHYFNDKNKLPGNLHYLGVKPLDEVNGAIESSLCLIHTGEPEGFPNTFMQAWMQGKCVVSLEYDPDKIIENERMGFCANGSIETMNQQLSTLLDEPQKRKEMEKRASQFANEHFSPQKNVDQLEEFLRKVVQKKGGE